MRPDDDDEFYFLQLGWDTVGHLFFSLPASSWGCLHRHRFISWVRGEFPLPSVMKTMRPDDDDDDENEPRKVKRENDVRRLSQNT